jgi:hypothetical protein
VAIDKLYKKLSDYLDKGEHKKVAHCKRIDDLLHKLKKKEEHLKKKLSKETDTAKKKRLKTELKVVKAQRKKGEKRRTELKAKCK